VFVTLCYKLCITEWFVVQSRDSEQALVSRLRVVAKESGFYQCTATGHNSISGVSQFIRFIVTGKCCRLWLL